MQKKSESSEAVNIAMTFSLQQGVVLYKSIGNAESQSRSLQIYAKRLNQVNVKLYTKTPALDSRKSGDALPLAQVEHKEYKEKTISQIIDTPSMGSYLNLTSHERKDLKPRAVVGKLILDWELEFQPAMEDIRRVYFAVSTQRGLARDGSGDKTKAITVLDLDSDSVHSFILASAFDEKCAEGIEENTHLLDSQYEVAEAFMDKLRELSEGKLVLAMGFDVLCGDGCVLQRILESVEQSSGIVYKYGVETPDFKCTRMITQVGSLPNVFFHDVQVLVYQSLSPKEKKKIHGTEMPQCAELLELQLEQNKSEAMHLMQNNRRYTKTLHRIDTERNLIQQRVVSAGYMRLPLNFALYETLASCIQLWMMRAFIQNDVLIPIENCDVEEKESYAGAFLQHVPEELQFMPHYCVAEGDFFSLYPTVMVAHNISPETIAAEASDKTLSIDLNQELPGKEEDVVHFRQDRAGVIRLILEPLFKERREEKDPIRRQAIKSILVSVYGIMGSVHSPFYHPACARAITALGRKACVCALNLISSDVLKVGATVLCANTDSVTFSFNPKYIQNLQANWSELNGLIQEHLRSPLYQFELETGKLAICALYTQKIKQCIRVPIDLETLTGLIKKAKSLGQFDGIAAKFTKAQMKKSEEPVAEFISSFAFAKISNDRQRENGYLIDEAIVGIMAMEQDLDAMKRQRRIQELIQRGLLKLESAQQKRIDTLEAVPHTLKQFCSFLKNSRDQVYVYLKAVHGIQRGCMVLPVSGNASGSRQSSSNWIDLETFTRDAHMYRLDKGKLAALFYQPTKLFFDISDARDMPRESGEESAKFSIQAAKESDAECCVRIETLAGRSTSYEAVGLDFDQLEQLINRAAEDGRKQVSYHEIFTHEINRAFFDVDFKNPPQHFNPQDIELAIRAALRQSVSADYKVFIAEARIRSKHTTQGIQMVKSPAKASYHVTLNIACDMNTNRYIAQIAELNLRNTLFGHGQEECKSEGDIFDTAIYALNKSLRLPMCGKITRNVYEPRFLIPLGGAKLRDFFASDVSNTVCTIPFNIMLDKRPAVDLPSVSLEVSKIDEGMFKQFLKEKCGSVQWTLNRSVNQFLTARPDRSYKCPVCAKTHSHRGVFAFRKSNALMINCFSNVDLKTVEQLIAIPIPGAQKKSDYEKIQTYYKQMTMPVYKEATRVCEQRDIRYQLESDLVFIISDMGTGKSKQLNEIMQEKVAKKTKGKLLGWGSFKYETVICLGFRKTFVTEFAKKFDLVSYEDIVGQMDLATNPRMIIQVDSLMRLNVSKFPQLLIVDEVESILSKLLSCSNSGGVCQAFLQLIRNSATVVIMDGLMEPRTIQYMRTLRGTEDVSVVINTFKPRSDYSMVIHPYRQINAQHIAELFLRTAKGDGKPKNVYGMITSYKLGEFVRRFLRQEGIAVVYYHGENGLLETTDEGEMTQQDLKTRDFADVNKFWKQYQVVIHTSSVTAGISFEEHHFDHQINVFNSGTCDPGSFFQGSHRVRNIDSRVITTFIEIDHTQQITSPAGYSDLEFDIGSRAKAVHVIKADPFSHLISWLKAREGCLLQFRLQLLLKYIKLMDYKVEVLPIEADATEKRMDLDLGYVDKMLGFKLSEVEGEKLVKPADQQAYAHKMNLFFLFGRGMPTKALDELNMAQLELLYKQRHFQKLRRTVNIALGTQFGYFRDQVAMYQDFKKMIQHIQQDRYTADFIDLDTVKLVKDTAMLIDEVVPLLAQAAQKGKVGSRPFKVVFDQLSREAKSQKRIPWAQRVKTLLAPRATELGINRPFKSDYTLLERICKLFTLKLDQEGAFYIPDSVFLAVQDSLVPKPLGADANKQEPSEETSTSDASETGDEQENFDILVQELEADVNDRASE